jgi:hypothetical protein
MKSFKQWLMALMAVSMLLGVATACTDGNTEEEDTEQTDENEGSTEDSGE